MIRHNDSDYDSSQRWGFGVIYTNSNDGNLYLHRLTQPPGNRNIDDVEGGGINMHSFGFTTYVQFGGTLGFGELILDGGEAGVKNEELEFGLFAAGDDNTEAYLTLCNLTMERVGCVGISKHSLTAT